MTLNSVFNEVIMQKGKKIEYKKNLIIPPFSGWRNPRDERLPGSPTLNSVDREVDLFLRDCLGPCSFRVEMLKSRSYLPNHGVGLCVGEQQRFRFGTFFKFASFAFWKICKLRLAKIVN